MLDAKSATEEAFYEALAGGITKATVYQDAPADAPLPLVIIGDLSARPLGSDGDMIVSASVFAQVEAEERAPLLELQSQIQALLHDQDFSVPGWRIAPDFETDTAELGDDGQTYVGVSVFRVAALKA